MFDLCTRETFADRRQQHEIDETRIELCSAPGFDDPQRFLDTRAGAVAPIMRERVERVGDRDDPRLERNTRTTQAPWISRPVPALVM